VTFAVGWLKRHATESRPARTGSSQPHPGLRTLQAQAAARTKNTYLASQYARIRGRRGPKPAAVAVAHSILVIAWHLLTRHEPYTDLGADYFVQRQSSQAYQHRLVRQLERMGHKVTLEPADAA
jgi:transposase